MRPRHILVTVLALLVLSVLSLPVAAREAILSFDSRIQVEPSGAVTVFETIIVQAEGREIRRGIYRDLPRFQAGPYGLRTRTGLRILEVRRGNQPEPWHEEVQGDMTRIYIGDAQVFLDPGEYRYTLVYAMERQVRFFPEYDEIYWNVTGDQWSFPIEEATVTVILPGGAAVKQWAAYTGRRGSTARDAELLSLEGDTVIIRATRPLEPGEGFTVAVGFTKGLVREPTRNERIATLLRDNLSAVAGLGGILALALYYLVAWFLVGRDPVPGTIVPRFRPPKGLSPAAARYVRSRGFDSQAFAAALVNMAVKGHVRIENHDGGYAILRDNRKLRPLSMGERKALRRLLGGSLERIELDRVNHQRIRAAREALKATLAANFAAVNFRLNRMWLIPGIVLSLVTLGVMFFYAPVPEVALFMGVWLSGWSVGCAFLLVSAYHGWQEVRRGKGGMLGVGGALYRTLFALPFLAGWVAGCGMLVMSAGLPACVCLAIIVAINAVFFKLLEAPTLQGRALLDELEGFVLYLRAAERDRLNMLNPPEKTPELFERYLPWALALDVGQEWAEQFAEVLEAAGRDQGGSTWQPLWYGGARDFSASSLAGGLGPSLSSQLASSSMTPSSSSSGSGGGGFSGGGGGGGGGGGW